MRAPQKLTKKQKKSIAFRVRTTGKLHPRNGLIEMENFAVPIMEGQDIASAHSHTPEVQEVNQTVSILDQDKQGWVASKGKGKGRAEEKDASVSVEAVKTTKRKRAHEGGVEEEDQTLESQSRKVLKRKKDNNVTQSNETKNSETKNSETKNSETKNSETKNSETKNSETKKTAVKQRFILFVGNLKYTTTREVIQAHFAVCDPPPTIRLLTPTSASGSQRAKSKGCAFLEFTHRNALQQALKLHQSTLEGRVINVELTAGGGGKSESRLAKVRERNKALLVQRTERIEMEDPNSDRILQRPQRFSSTSGMVQVPVAKRSWAVGDGNDGATHRGGLKHKKNKAWGTGVNAIPVG